MRKCLTVVLIIILSFSCLAEDKVKFIERSRYMFDEYLINTNFVDFVNNDVKGHENVKSLGYRNYGNVRCYQFNLIHSFTGYNTLDVYVTKENRILKTFLTHSNELAVMTEDEDWMRYVHIDEGEFVVGSIDIDKPINGNWVERQWDWTYETFVPSKEFVNDCTPSKETMKTVGIIILVAVVIVAICFGGVGAANMIT